MPDLEIPGTVQPIEGPVPLAEFRWDAETEILGCSFPSVGEGRGLTGSMELEDAAGAVVTLDFESGVLRGVEIVVWPPAEVIPTLAPPAVTGNARLLVPARPSQPGTAVVEFDTHLSVERTPEDRIIRLLVGESRVSGAVAVADRVLVELDGHGAPCGIWLLDVPPFPTGVRG